MPHSEKFLSSSTVLLIVICFTHFLL